MHGGKVGENAGAPVGNKNALATGEHEAIWADQLEDDERNLLPSIVTDEAKKVDQDIKLTEIRIRRMMKRIGALRAKGELSIVEIIDEQGTNAGGPVDLTKTKSESTLNQIQRIEDALTRVQTHMVKLLEYKHKLAMDAKGGEAGDDGLKALADALRKSREAQDD